MDERTPRTNAERRRIKRTNTLDSECVGLKFARTLEREMNAVRGELEKWKQAVSDGDAARDRVRWDGDTNMIACRKERDQLRTTNTELLNALRGFLYEYDDREAQFGSDCFRQKRVDADTIDKARAAITRATEKPAQTES